MNRTALARAAAHAAIKARQQYRLGLARAISPFDLALRMGISVRFAALPSLEGIYQAGPKPVILVSALRPPGRQAYTCSHEIGHHVFGHGTRVDEILDRDDGDMFDPNEYLAQRFASALLMPKLAVETAFARRGWRAAAPTPESVFVVAQDLGVGYTALVGHLQHTLSLISRHVATGLLRRPLKRLRRDLAGFEVPYDIFVFDENWGERPVELEVGDVLLVPPYSKTKGASLREESLPRRHLVAVAPGKAEVSRIEDGCSVEVLVARREYQGLARYRHLEDPDHAG